MTDPKSTPIQPHKGSPFSNSTEWEIWSSGWCNRCQVDAPVREREDYANGCPLIVVALSGETPAEWLEQPTGSPDRYHCVNFRAEDDNPPGDDPDRPPANHPESPIPGQLEIVSRDDYERPKVFADVAKTIKRVDA